LKISELFLQVFGFIFKPPQYWCGEHFDIIFLVNQFLFHN
jgi:hypothetical protein